VREVSAISERGETAETGSVGGCAGGWVGGESGHDI
jgi:hypothetical protein